jgi:adenosylhomocysteine nucleosidase
MILAVTGLSREARIVAGPGVTTLSCGGNTGLLHQKLERAIAEGVDGIISIGIAGGLMASLKPGDCIIGSEVVVGAERYLADRAWTVRMNARLPEAILAPLTGTDAIVTDENDKAALFLATAASAVDTESHVVARLASLHQIPFAALRTVSDPADSRLPPLVSVALTSEGKLNYRAVLNAVLAEPRQIPALIRTARESKAALDALLRCRDALGLRLAGPEGRSPASDLG